MKKITKIIEKIRHDANNHFTKYNKMYTRAKVNTTIPISIADFLEIPQKFYLMVVNTRIKQLYVHR